jgi:hypothetical protein
MSGMVNLPLVTLFCILSKSSAHPTTKNVPSPPEAVKDRVGFGPGVTGSASDATDCSESVRSITSREKRGDFLRGGSSIEVMQSAGGGFPLKPGRKITASRNAVGASRAKLYVCAALLGDAA